VQLRGLQQQGRLGQTLVPRTLLFLVLLLLLLLPPPLPQRLEDFVLSAVRA
jgi:hypothetical protein